MENFKGYHAEWNLGCPGGWEYQWMAQARGKLCWNWIKKITGIEIELDFEHPILNPFHDSSICYCEPIALISSGRILLFFL